MTAFGRSAKILLSGLQDVLSFVNMSVVTETILQNNISDLPETIDPKIEEMMKVGVHLGHAKTKNHPTMQPYIFGVRNTISLINLVKTKEKLDTALKFAKEIAAKGGLILLVGTRPAAKKIIFEGICDA